MSLRPNQEMKAPGLQPWQTGWEAVLYQAMSHTLRGGTIDSCEKLEHSLSGQGALIPDSLYM